MTPAKRIRIGSAVLIVKGDQVLLGRRNKSPNFGRWILPGGKIEYGETHQDAAVREIDEELGVDIEVLSLAGKGIYNLITQHEHRMIVYSNARIVGGELNPSSDVSEARFFYSDELESLDITPIVREVLKDEGWIQ